MGETEKCYGFYIVGYGKRTLKTIGETGGKIDYQYTTESDGTVPLLSAEAVKGNYFITSIWME